MYDLLEPAKTIQTAVVLKAVHGDTDAKAWLYRQYSKAMFNICIRMTGSRPCAEDVLQDAFILAFRQLAQLKDPDSFGGWLRRIVVNECIRHSKRSFYWNEWEPDQMEEIADEAGEWWTSLSMEMIHEQIKKLPEGCRQVFVLYVLEDFTHKDIAADLGISESTSKSQYQRARQLLKDRIGKQVATHG